MSKKSDTEILLAKLEVLEETPTTRQALTAFRRFLGTSPSIIAARVARIAARHEINELVPNLVKAFERFLTNGAKTDSGCKAKDDIVQALTTMNHDDPDLFLKGVRCVQMETVYGGKVDTAANLRANCAMGLANTRYRDVHFVLTDLLADPEVAPRRAAVQTLAHLRNRECELLLRYKARSGDDDVSVMADIFSGLLAINRHRNIPFVAEYLGRSPVALANQAALALGETRADEALEILFEQWDNNILPAKRKALVLPIALVRNRKSLEFLLDIIYQGGPLAKASVEALAIYASDRRRRKQVEKAVKDSHEEPLQKVFAKFFK